MNIVNAIFILLITSFYPLQASDSPTVDKLVGTATLNSLQLKIKQEITTSGTLITENKSIVRIYVPQWNSSIVIGPKTEMLLDFKKSQQEKKIYELKDGICRWVSFLKSKNSKDSHIFTKTASMGIRGTDFEIQHKNETGETEIIVFSGKVLLKSNLNGSEKLIESGEWGGVGGKFGESVNEPKKLTRDQLHKAKKRTSEHASYLHRNKDAQRTYD